MVCLRVCSIFMVNTYTNSQTTLVLKRNVKLSVETSPLLLIIVFDFCFGDFGGFGVSLWFACLLGSFICSFIVVFLSAGRLILDCLLYIDLYFDCVFRSTIAQHYLGFFGGHSTTCTIAGGHPVVDQYPVTFIQKHRLYFTSFLETQTVKCILTSDN